MLSLHDHQVIAESLKAAADGPFFPDWEFHSLFGFARDEIRGFAAAYIPADDVPVHMGYAIHNALANLLGYPHGKDAEWSLWLSVEKSDLEKVFGHWRSHCGYT